MEPIQLDDLFLVTANIDPDMAVADVRAELDKMLLANSYATQFTNHLKNGTLTLGFCEEYADCLAECDVEPYVWLEHVQTEAGLILTSGIPYDI